MTVNSAQLASLALLGSLVNRSSGTSVAPHTDARFHAALKVRAQRDFWYFERARLHLPQRVVGRSVQRREVTDTDAVLLAERSHHAIRILARSAHRSDRNSPFTSREYSIGSIPVQGERAVACRGFISLESPSRMRRESKMRLRSLRKRSERKSAASGL